MTPTPDQPRPDAAAIVMHITRSQVPALSDALCRGIEHIEQELADLPEVMAYTQEREGLANDFRAMLALRDDLQRQANAALAARQGEATDGR